MESEFLYRSVSRTACGRVRTVNQDAVFTSDAAGLWGVSDGMGGHASGEIASAHVVECLEKTANPSNRSDPKQQRVKYLLDEANRHLLERSAADGLKFGMGATVAVLGMDGSRYFCLWVGDSRIYRLRSDRLTQLTRDHRYVQGLVDSGALDREAARAHHQRNILTRAVGLENDLVIDEREGTITADDVFLIATDGITDLCHDDEIETILRFPDLTCAADQFITLCNERGSPDNLSVVLVRIIGGARTSP
jgi:serine/threonine protein phosphatase PrpC